MHDEADNAQPRPEGETHDQLVAEYRSLTRGLAQDLVTLGSLGIGGTVTGYALKTGAHLADATAAKVKDARTPKPSPVELPPGVEE